MKKQFIIAEVGSNWLTKRHCIESIRRAKACGANAVKFQAYNSKALYGHSGELEGTLPLEWIPDLSKECFKVGINFMCSAFSAELVNFINPFVKYHKVASAELCHIGILDAINKTEKTVFLSIGASNEKEVRFALSRLDQCKVILMYCTASYPARYGSTTQIYELRNKYKKPVGFSDHTLDVYEAPMNSITYGSVAIEKHVNFCGVASPDSPHSLSEDEFAEMVSALRTNTIMTTPTPDERSMLSTHKRRLIAIKDIEIGDTLILGKNFDILRAKTPMACISPMFAEIVNGKKSNSKIKAFEGIKQNQVDFN